MFPWIPIVCGVISVAGNVIHYTGGTVPVNTAPPVFTPCNVSINVNTTVAGVFTGTSTAITSNEGGAGAAATATLNVA